MSAGPCRNVCTSHCLLSVDFERDAERCWRQGILCVRLVLRRLVAGGERGEGGGLRGVGQGWVCFDFKWHCYLLESLEDWDEGREKHGV